MVDCGCEGREPTNGRLGTVLRPTCQKTKQLHTQILSGQNKTTGWENKTNSLLEGSRVEKKALVSFLSKSILFMYLNSSIFFHISKKLFLNQGRLLFGTVIVK